MPNCAVQTLEMGPIGVEANSWSVLGETGPFWETATLYLITREQTPVPGGEQKEREIRWPTLGPGRTMLPRLLRRLVVHLQLRFVLRVVRERVAVSALEESPIPPREP